MCDDPCSLPLKSCEFLRIREDGPECLARARDLGRQRRIAILQQTQYLHQQQIIPLPQLAQRGLLVGVEGAELAQKVIHLVFQGQLGEDANGVCAAQAVLEAG